MKLRNVCVMMIFTCKQSTFFVLINAIFLLLACNCRFLEKQTFGSLYSDFYINMTQRGVISNRIMDNSTSQNALSVDIHPAQCKPLKLHQMTFDLIFSLLLNVWLWVNNLRIWARKNGLGQLMMLVAADPQSKGTTLVGIPEGRPVLPTYPKKCAPARVSICLQNATYTVDFSMKLLNCGQDLSEWKSSLTVCD